MATIQHRWLWIGAGVAAAAAALALGVPLGSVLIVAAALACPLAMYFGMRGMGMGQTWPTQILVANSWEGMPTGMGDLL
jgi:uncharacterized protein (DUF2062 family)